MAATSLFSLKRFCESICGVKEFCEAYLFYSNGNAHGNYKGIIGIILIILIVFVFC